MPTEQELKEFANALQLSIKTKIKDVKQSGSQVTVELHSKADLSDSNLFRFFKLIRCMYDSENHKFTIKDAPDIDFPKLTLFLLLTRMNDGNISKLIELDPSAAKIAERLGLKMPDNCINSVEQAAGVIFKKMSEGKMTIRELAESSGLTQVSISNFKAGKDIKLSNLIKIVRAVGLKIRID